MNFTEQRVSGCFLIEHELYEDDRGVFKRSFCSKVFGDNDIDFTVKQANISENKNKYTLRGFHYQSGNSKEAKILSCISGSIYNVVIDIRQNSKTYKQSFSIELNEKNRFSLYVPSGCANAYLTLKKNTVVNYLMGDYYDPSSYSGFRYNDPAFNIKWPACPKFISDKDLNHPNYDEK